MKVRLADIWPLLVIILFGLIIYNNTFWVPFVLDDYGNIVNNPTIRHLTNFAAMWRFNPTRFLTVLSLALNYHLHQLSLAGYHIFNLSIHLATGLVVYGLTLLTLRNPGAKAGIQEGRSAEKAVALFTALIFVGHPVQTQAVTYIIQRAASLAAFFYLLSLYLYAQFRTRRASGRFRSSRSYYLGSVLAALAAFFSKENTVTLPVAILLYELIFWKGHDVVDNGKRYALVMLRRLTPFLLVLCFFLGTVKMTGVSRFIEMGHLLTPVQETTAITPRQYLLTQFRVIATYLRLLILPINQNLDYDYPLAKTLFSAPVFASLILLLALLVSGFLLLRRYRILSFAIFWFFLTLAPESSIIPVRDVIFEHRLYLPLFGYALFLAVGLYYLTAMVVKLHPRPFGERSGWKGDIRSEKPPNPPFKASGGRPCPSPTRGEGNKDF